MTAFSSGTAPDIVHIGLEWVSQFAKDGVLEALEDSLTKDLSPALLPSVQRQASTYALPWVMNCRALFVRRDLLQSGDSTWIDLQRIVNLGMQQNPPLPFAIPSYEPHNVVKKVLPFLWSGGSTLLQASPVDQSVNNATIEALQFYTDITQKGLSGTSRNLDEKLHFGSLSCSVSGMWNLADSSVNELYAVMPRFMTHSVQESAPSAGKSILSADCYAINAASKNKSAAKMVLSDLARGHATRFCNKIPDAGFSARSSELNSEETRLLSELKKHDSKALRNRLAFLRQTRNSIPLVSPEYYLEAERIIEEELTQSVYAHTTAKQAVASMRERIRKLQVEARN